MSLVGDLILELRSRIPDAPGVAGVPQIFLTAVNVPGGFLVPGVGYIVIGTAVNAFGESSPSAEQVLVMPAGMNAILVVWNNLSDFGRAYLGAQNFSQWYQSLVPGQGGATLVLGDPNIQATVGAGVPPTRNTAFYPDSDGNFIGAYTMYRLLNRALQEMVKIAGGIIDVTGVQTTVNQSMYRLAAPFYQFVNAWYDGYPMDVVQRSMMYLRNSAAGFSGILSYEQDGPQSVIQVWPQSNRTGGQNFLEAPLSATANTFLVSDARTFLSIGLAQIDEEIVVYSQITSGGTVFAGVTRGMGGTDSVAHNIFAPVTELNLRMSGYRMARTYNVGDSLQTIQVPQAWETPLVLHMLSQVRSMEQDDATAQKLLSDFQAQADKIAKQSRMGKIKPRQIPIWGQTGTDARNVNGIGFGWLIN
jgi:hypothetical protein